MNATLDMALRLSKRGFLVFPCRQHDRRPATNNGFKDATMDERQIRTWFSHGNLNLAVATGPQPNGINLVAIDVDPHNGGLVAWNEYIRTHDVPITAKTDTPSLGFHLFFNASVEVPNGRSRIGPGIDVRGTGGYVVYPPSVAPSKLTGELLPYTTYADRTITDQHHVWDMPSDLQASCLPPTVNGNGHRAGPLSLVNTGDSVADLAREGWDWHAELGRDGWICARLRGDDSEWTRPGKDPRLGTSATLHGRGSGPLVVWSTALPPGGKPTTGHVGNSFSPWDYIVAFRAGGDTREAARLVRGVAPAPRRAAPARTPDSDDTPGDKTSSLNLPGSFWEARPILAHIRQAAWSAGCSPDALLVQSLARVATFVHPCFKLPGVEQGLIGKPQTLDFLGCVVAETSGGKTLAAGVAELLVPAPEQPFDGSDPLIDFEQKVGSGEGIAEFFLVPELKPDDDGKLVKTGKRVIGKQALFMNVDEGTGFTSQAGRKGTTIIATLASAWSGESLGQLNAAEETRRLVRGGRVRICAVINMQDSNGYKLYSDELESVGFTGRLMFASAHDPGAPAPDVAPEWPGRLVWPVRGGSSTGNLFFTYASAITSEIKGTRFAILTKQMKIERRQSQYLLLRCKVAALFAVLDGRTNVSEGDWSLATEAVSMSAAVLGHLDYVHSQQVEVTAVTAASFKMQVAESAEQQHLRRLAVGWKPRVIEELQAKGPLSWKGLKGLVRADRRTMFRTIVDEMVAEGVLRLEGSTYSISR